MLIINDDRVCGKCGAYLDAFEICVMGHIQPPIVTAKEFADIMNAHDKTIKKIEERIRKKGY